MVFSQPLTRKTLLNFLSYIHRFLSFCITGCAFLYKNILSLFLTKYKLFVGFRYGAYAVNFDVPSRDRTITKFGEEFKKVISNNGFPSEHLLTLLPLETEEVIISTSSSFTMLPASEYPSKASESVWSVSR